MYLHDFTGAKHLYRILIIVAPLLFSGCVMHSVDQSAVLLGSPVQTDSREALQRMQQSMGDNKTSWQLLAIRALLTEGKSQQAGALFRQLPSVMDVIQRQEQALLAAELALARHNVVGAQALLVKINPADLKGTQQVRYWQNAVATMQGKPSPELLMALIMQVPLLTTIPEKQQNIDTTWQVLTTLSQAQVATVTPPQRREYPAGLAGSASYLG